MRSSKNRSRSKSNRQRSIGNIINRVFDSSGPEGKVRGTPQQIIEKYVMLARDAQLGNDRVAEQNFLQHAEHYTRMLGEANAELAREQAQRQAQGGGPRERSDDEGEGAYGLRDEEDGPALVETPESRNRARDDRAQGDRSQGERRDGRPQFDRRDDRGQGERRDERAAQERRDERASVERRDERGQGERRDERAPQERRDDRGQTERAERHQGDRAQGERRDGGGPRPERRADTLRREEPFRDERPVHLARGPASGSESGGAERPTAPAEAATETPAARRAEAMPPPQPLEETFGLPSFLTEPVVIPVDSLTEPEAAPKPRARKPRAPSPGGDSAA